MYALWDRAAGMLIGSILMLMPSDEAAARSLSDLAKDPRTMVGSHPEDYEIWYVGDVDLHSGEVMPCTPGCVAKAMEFVSASEEV